MNDEIVALNERFAQYAEQVQSEIKMVIVNQDKIIDKLFIMLTSSGYVFIEGVPRLGKTFTIQ
ncbi:MAG: hypothetical protein KAI50_14475 [Desulfobacterales bacterium]|nr:hypothetical protein [Desulfobacterales bacterium]